MVIALDISPISGKSDHKFRGVGKYITLLFKNLEKYDKKNKYLFFDRKIPLEADIVHYPYFDPFFVNIPLRRNKKTIVTIHDVIPLVHSSHFPAGLKGTLKLALNKRIIKNIEGIIVDSNASKEDANKVFNIKFDKIHTVYLSCDEDYRPLKKKIPNKFNLPEEFILYVGDVTWNKNLPRLIQAVEKVKIPLIMVGKAISDLDYDKKNPWNNDRNIVNQLTYNNSLFQKLGFVSNDDLNELYNSAIALCMPSLDEGFGLPVLEAMNAGCPVLCSSFGSLPEVGGNAACYINAEDIDDIASGIAKIANDKKYRSEMIKRGFSQARKFSLEKMIKDTVSVYEKYA